MRKIIFIFALLISFATVKAMTVEQLMDKYRAFPDVDQTLLEGDALVAHLDSLKEVGEEVEIIDAERMEFLIMQLDDDLRSALNDEVKTLDGYELLATVSHNEPIFEFDAEQSLGKLFGDLQVDFSILANIYGIPTDDDMVRNPLYVVDFMDMNVLVHVIGILDLHDAENLVSFKIDTTTDIDEDDEDAFDDLDDDEDTIDDDDEEGAIISLSDISKYKKRVVLVNGELIPGLETTEDVARYLSEHGQTLSIQTIYTGSKTIKEKFPDIDADLVIDYTGVQ